MFRGRPGVSRGRVEGIGGLDTALYGVARHGRAAWLAGRLLHVLDVNIGGFGRGLSGLGALNLVFILSLFFYSALR